MKLLVVLSACVAFVLANRTGIDAEFELYVDAVFDRIDRNDDGLVGVSELDAFFKRYDNKDANPEALNVYEPDYNTGSVSAVSEFGIDGRHAAAYFKLQDLVDYYDESPDVFCRLTTEDSYVAVLIGDEDWDEQLTEEEFKNAFKRIYRGSSSALFFVDSRANEGTGNYDDQLELDNWMNIITRVTGDDSATSFVTNDWVAFWTDNGYGGVTQAKAIFDILDLESSGTIQNYEWELVFLIFDVDGDEKLAVEEFLALDYYLNEGAGQRIDSRQFKATKNARVSRLLEKH